MKTLAIVAALAVVSGAGPAGAVTCMTLLNGMAHCTDPAQSAPVAPVAPLPVVAPPAYGHSGPGLIGLMQSAQEASRRKHVGQLISQGRCDEARKYALDHGDLGLAGEVRDLCQ